MVHRNGFSLIETLAAILIASLSAMALLQAVSNVSRQTVNVSDHYDRTILEGALIGSINEEMYGRNISGGEILQSRYGSINDPDLLEMVDSEHYRIYKKYEESLDPTNSLSSVATTSFPLSLEEVQLQNSFDKHSKRFYRIGGIQ